jgi:hypothetical protein
MKPLLPFLILMPAAVTLHAWQETPPADLAEPPPLPPKIQNEEVIPTVNIRQEEDRLVEEYSLDGRVYMVKITPAKGPPYYYIDEDGDGQLELQPGDDAMNPVRPAYWKVKEWD